MLDQALWHLPFATKTDLETAAKRGDLSIEKRTGFLNTLLSEHSCPAAQEQLKNLWSKWIEKNYSDADDGEDEIVPGRCATPTDEDLQAAIELLAAETATEAAGAAGAAEAAGAAGAAGGVDPALVAAANAAHIESEAAGAAAATAAVQTATPRA